MYKNYTIYKHFKENRMWLGVWISVHLEYKEC